MNTLKIPTGTIVDVNNETVKLKKSLKIINVNNQLVLTNNEIIIKNDDDNEIILKNKDFNNNVTEDNNISSDKIILDDKLLELAKIASNIVLYDIVDQNLKENCINFLNKLLIFE